MALQTETKQTTRTIRLYLTDLNPAPDDVWRQMLEFSGPTSAEVGAMRQTVDVLFQRGYELVVDTYEYLSQVPETAEILGWESGIDEQHLAERRRFFTIWLARTISIDLGTDFSRYLFRAGQIHAAHGPRRIHTPPTWITGSMGLVLSKFAAYISTAHDDVQVVTPALAGWNKVLMMHLNQMHAGYHSAIALDNGDHILPVRAYGTARRQWGRDAIDIHYSNSDTVAAALQKLMNYAPVLREIIFTQSWQARDDEEHLWMHVEPQYVLRGNWRILLNGRDLRYHGGFDSPLEPGDELSLFPPGR